MAEIVIDVGARLRLLQSSVADIQRALNSLKPDTAAYKTFSNLLNIVKNQMSSIGAEVGKGFGSEKSFKTTETAIEKMETAIEKMKYEMSNIDFKDLKLDNSIVQQLDDLQNKIEQVRNGIKADFLKGSNVTETLKLVDPNLLTADLNTIESKVSATMSSVEEKIASTAAAFSKLTQAGDLNKLISDLEKLNSSSDFVKQTQAGKNFGLFSQFFDIKNNRIAWGGSGNAKEMKQQLLDTLKEVFTLTPDEINKIVSDLEGEYSAQGVFNKLIKNITNDSKSYLAGSKSRNTATQKANLGSEQQLKELQAYYEQLQDLSAKIQEAKEKMNASGSSYNPELKALEEQFSSVQEKALAAWKNIGGGAAEKVRGNIAEIRGEVEQLSTAFLKQQAASQSLNSIKMAITNFMGMRQIFRMITDGVRNALDHIKQLDSAMNGIAIVSNLSTSDLWKQIDAYSEMAQRFGTTIQGAYDVSKIYYQAGYDTQQVLTLTNETLKFAAISGVNYADSTDYMMTALRGFKMEVEDASRVVDVYSNLAANTAVSQEELAVAMSKTASSMESVGATFEESSAMIATMVAVTRESATNIGTALKSIAARYGELTKNPDKIINIDGEEASFNKVDTALQSIGITLKDEEGQFRSITEVIRELAGVWDQLSSVQQRYVATSFAGNRQQSRFLALVSNKDLFEENLDNALNAEGVGTSQALEYLDSIEAKMNQVQVAYQQFYTNMGIEGVWKGFLDGAKSVIETLNSLPKLFGKLPTGAASGIISVISLIKNALFSLIGTLGPTIAQALEGSFDITKKSMSDAGAEGGAGFIDALVARIKGGASVVKTAITGLAAESTAALGSAAWKKGDKLNPEGLTDTQSSMMTDLSAAAKAYEESKTISEYDKFDYGFELSDITSEKLEELKNKFDQFGDIGRKAFLSIGKEGKTVAQAVEQVKTETASMNQEFEKTYKQARQQTLKQGARIASTIGNAATMVALQQDTSTREGQQTAGYIQGFGAVATGASAVMSFMAHDYASGIMATVQTIMQLSNAIGLINETESEKAARLQKDAEEAKNKAVQARTDEQNLENNLNKVKKLGNTRYNSEEDAEEYNNAVNALAAQFPQLIKGFDDAGVAILDVNAAERALTEARVESAKAARVMLQAERASIKQNMIGALDDFRTFALQRFNAFDISKYDSTRLQTLDVASSQSKDLQTIYELIRGGELKSLSVENVLDGTLDSFFQAYYSIINSDNMGGLTKTSYKTLLEIFPIDEVNKLFTLASSYPKDLGNNIQQAIQNSIDLARLDNTFSNKQLETGMQKTFDLAISRVVTAMYNNAKDADPYIGEIEDYLDITADGGQFLAEYVNWLNNATDKTLKNFYDFLININSYNETDINQILTTFGLSNTPWMQQLLEALLPSKEELWASITDVINEIKKKRPEQQDITDKFLLQLDQVVQHDSISQDLIYLVNNMASSLREIEDTNPQLGKALYDYYFQMFVILQKLDNTQEKSKLIALLLNSDFTSYEGWQEFYKQIEELNLTDYWAEIENKNLTQEDQAGNKQEFLPKLQETAQKAQDAVDRFIINEIQSELAEWNSTANDLQKYASKVTTDGLELNEAEEYINLLQQNGINNISLADFQSNNGKLYLTAKQNQEILSSIIEQAEQDINSTGKILEFYGNEIQLGADGLESKRDRWLDINLAANFDFIKLIPEIWNLLDNKIKEQIENGKITYGGLFRILINDLKDMSDESPVKTYNQLLNNAAQKIIDENKEWQLELELNRDKLANWSAGNYSNLGISVDELFEAELSLTQEQKDAKDNIVKGLDSFLNDIIKATDLSQINIESYELPIEWLPEIESMMQGSRENLIRRYVQKTGMDIETANDLLAQAIEKDKQNDISTWVNAIKAQMKNLTKSSDGIVYATLDTIKAIANALNIPLDALKGEYNQVLDQYQVKFENERFVEAVASIDGFFDSLNSVFANLASYLSQAITGKLNADNVDDFIKQVNQAFGENFLQYSDFTKTADGLRLSAEQAMKLYFVLQQVDSIAAGMVFDDLSKSLMENNDHYKDMTSNLERIEELNKLIANTPTSDARYQQYLAELKVAQEIARVRATTEDKSWDFMNGSVPSSFNNPVKFMESWGEAFDVMKAADKKGYIKYDDFYNLMQGFDKLGLDDASNQLLLSGMGFRDNVTSFSDAVIEGYNSLKYVSGVGMTVDLSNIGVQFQAGAEDMQDGVTKGIQDVAKSQVEMLDSMIALLEVIVTMEDMSLNIDTNGDNTFDMGEIFKGWNKDIGFADDETIYFQDNVKNFADKLLGMSKDNDKLADLINNVFFEDQSLQDLLKTIQNGETTGKNAALYQQVLNALYKMALSNNYDLDNLWASIQQVMAESGFEGTIKIGDTTYTIIMGQTLVEVKGGGWQAASGGPTFQDPNDAAAYAIYQAAGYNFSKEQIESAVKKNDSWSIEVDPGSEINIVVKDGQAYIQYGGNTYSSLDAAYEAWYRTWVSEQGEGVNTSRQAFVSSNKLPQKNAEEVFNASVAIDEDKFNQLTTQEFDQAKSMVSDAVQSGDWSNVDLGTLKANFGIEISLDENGEMSQSGQDILTALFGIEEKEIQTTWIVDETGQKILSGTTTLDVYARLHYEEGEEFNFDEDFGRSWEQYYNENGLMNSSEFDDYVTQLLDPISQEIGKYDATTLKYAEIFGNIIRNAKQTEQSAENRGDNIPNYRDLMEQDLEEQNASPRGRIIYVTKVIYDLSRATEAQVLNNLPEGVTPTIGDLVKAFCTQLGLTYQANEDGSVTIDLPDDPLSPAALAARAFLTLLGLKWDSKHGDKITLSGVDAGTTIDPENSGALSASAFLATLTLMAQGKDGTQFLGSGLSGHELANTEELSAFAQLALVYFQSEEGTQWLANYLNPGKDDRTIKTNWAINAIAGSITFDAETGVTKISEYITLPTGQSVKTTQVIKTLLTSLSLAAENNPNILNDMITLPTGQEVTVGSAVTALLNTLSELKPDEDFNWDSATINLGNGVEIPASGIAYAIISQIDQFSWGGTTLPETLTLGSAAEGVEYGVTLNDAFIGSIMKMVLKWAGVDSDMDWNQIIQAVKNASVPPITKVIPINVELGLNNIHQKGWHSGIFSEDFAKQKVLEEMQMVQEENPTTILPNGFEVPILWPDFSNREGSIKPSSILSTLGSRSNLITTMSPFWTDIFNQMNDILTNGNALSAYDEEMLNKWLNEARTQDNPIIKLADGSTTSLTNFLSQYINQNKLNKSLSAYDQLNKQAENENLTNLTDEELSELINQVYFQKEAIKNSNITNADGTILAGFGDLQDQWLDLYERLLDLQDKRNEEKTETPVEVQSDETVVNTEEVTPPNGDGQDMRDKLPGGGGGVNTPETVSNTTGRAGKTLLSNNPNRGSKPGRTDEPEEETSRNKDQTRNEINEYYRNGYGGNVNLYNRPEVSVADMAKAGWDIGEDAYATLFSSTMAESFTKDVGVVVNITPITEDGKVLTPEQLDEYFANLMANSTNSQELLELDAQQLGLIINFSDVQMGDDWDAIIEAMVQKAQLIHTEQEQIKDDAKVQFEADTTQIETATTSVLTNMDLIEMKEVTAKVADGTEKARAGLSELLEDLKEIEQMSYTLNAQINVYKTALDDSKAKGTANAKGTLMGELGPELVVQGGRFFTVGENGAEFVNLADDAIVFNHLQTRQLLNGGTTGRGRAVTNERNAVAFAGGNVSGPAMASAKAALASLKQLRAMWQSLLGASAKDLGSKAGGGGGSKKKGKDKTDSGEGGGGGGGGAEAVTIDPGFIADLERWYNLLRQIERLEQEINYEESLRSKIESDRVINGKAYYESQKRSLKALDQEIARNKELSYLQQSYYDARRRDLESTQFGKIFTFTENGLMQYNDEAVMENGDKGGLFALSKLNAQNVYGEAAYTAREQFELLKSWGFGPEMQYNDSGEKIFDQPNALTGEYEEEVYSNAVQAFWDKVDAWKDELDDLYDSYQEQLEKVLDNEDKRNQLLQEIIDNQLDLEKKVEEAIEEREQKVIDALKDERDALKDATDAYLNGLNDQLDRERKMYDRQQSENDLNKLRRQLAILQRTGGSAAEIESLRKQLSEKERDSYFEAQQDQIDAIKEASDLELERLDHQIDIMEETLEYQKEHGLLWAEVTQIMRGTPEQIMDFIKTYTPSYQSNSELQISEDLRELKGSVEQWVAYQMDKLLEEETTHNWDNYVESAHKRYEAIWTDENVAKAQAAFAEEYAISADPNRAGAMADLVFGKLLDEYFQEHPEKDPKNAQYVVKPAEDEENTNTNKPLMPWSDNGIEAISPFQEEADKLAGYNRTTGQAVSNSRKSGSGKKKTNNDILYSWIDPSTGKITHGTDEEYQKLQTGIKYNNWLTSNDYINRFQSLLATGMSPSAAQDYLRKYYNNKNGTSFASGGSVDFTGPAMLHGSKTDPEYVLNAAETHMWKDRILGGHNSLTSSLLNLNDMVQGILAVSNGASNANTTDGGIIIENASVNMNATISNDYDARRAGEQALDEMVKIARKSATRGIRG